MTDTTMMEEATAFRRAMDDLQPSAHKTLLEELALKRAGCADDYAALSLMVPLGDVFHEESASYPRIDVMREVCIDHRPPIRRAIKRLGFVDVGMHADRFGLDAYDLLTSRPHVRYVRHHYRSPVQRFFDWLLR